VHVGTAPLRVPHKLFRGDVLSGDADGDVNGNGHEGAEAPRENGHPQQEILCPAWSTNRLGRFDKGQ
jgi:hypothetical protein